MMTEINIDDETYQFFVQEALEFLQDLESGLLTLRQEHSINKIHSLMRAAHSIKGGAACVGLTGIQTLAHQLENGLKALYKEDIEFDQELEELLLQSYDLLRSPLQEQIETGKCETDTAIEKLKTISAQLEDKLGYSLEEETLLPEVESDLDLTQFLFTQEIARGIDRWESLLTNSQIPELVEQLKIQAEVFVSIGQLLNLPDFVAIAKTTILALQNNPSQAQTIGRLAASDFRLFQAAVLRGDRSPAVNPSSQLMSLVSSPKAKNVKRSHPEVKPLTSSLLEDLEVTYNQLQTPLLAELPTSSLLEDLEKTSSDLLTSPKAFEAAGSLLEDLEKVFDNNSGKAGEIGGRGEEDAGNVLQELSLSPPLPVSVSPTFPIPPSDTLPLQVTSSDSHAEIALKVEQNPKLGVRVDLERLDLLNNLVGDLVTQENSFLLQYQQNKETLEAITQKLNRLYKQTRDRLSKGARGRGREGKRGRGEVPVTPRSSLLTPHQSPIALEQTVVEEIAQLQEALQDLALTHQQVQQIIKKRQQTVKKLQNNLLQARMLPLGNLLNRFPRMIRDLAIKNQKQVTLQLIGMSTLIDKAILEKLYDPLIQMVRNAFDHGIETPEKRQAQGKSPDGTITIRAYHRGNHTYIEVQDDGQGIDPEKISLRAVALNWLSPSQGSTLPKNRLYEYLFAPGFSTATKVSELSGRGVGLEVVRHQVGALKGSISVTSEPGKGTTFTLRLPFTLIISKLLIFSVNSKLLAIPLDTLVAIAAVPEKQIETHQGNEFYQWQGRMIPVYSHSLLSSYKYSWTPPACEQLRSSYPWQQPGKVSLLLICGGDRVIALKIDQILMEQDLVIKPFNEAIAPPPYIYGCTILGNGRLVPVIDGPRLVWWLQQKKPVQTSSVSIVLDLNNLKRFSSPLILAIDDSLTIRKSVSLMLNKEGYRVLQARNGWEAIELLRQHPEIKAIICDIEMPQMNGFEFLSRCRKEFSDRSLPIVMLTCRSSEKYRLLAKQLGANAYLTKPYLDKKLLNTLKNCLE